MPRRSTLTGETERKRHRREMRERRNVQRQQQAKQQEQMIPVSDGSMKALIWEPEALMEHRFMMSSKDTELNKDTKNTATSKAIHRKKNHDWTGARYEADRKRKQLAHQAETSDQRNARLLAQRKRQADRRTKTPDQTRARHQARRNRTQAACQAQTQDQGNATFQTPQLPSKEVFNTTFELAKLKRRYENINIVNRRIKPKNSFNDKTDITGKVIKIPNLVNDLHSMIECIMNNSVHISFYPVQKSNGHVWVIQGPKKGQIVMLHYEQETELANVENEMINEDGDAIFVNKKSMDGCMIKSLTNKTNPDFEAIDDLIISAVMTNNIESIIPDGADFKFQQDEPSTSQHSNALSSCGETVFIKQEIVEDDITDLILSVENVASVSNNSDIVKELNLHHVSNLTPQNVQINLCQVNDHKHKSRKVTSKSFNTNRLNSAVKDTFDNAFLQCPLLFENRITSDRTCIDRSIDTITHDSSNKLVPELKLIHSINKQTSRVMILKPCNTYVSSNITKLRRSSNNIERDKRVLKAENSLSGIAPFTGELIRMPNLVDDLCSTIEYISNDIISISFHDVQKTNRHAWVIQGPKKGFTVILHYEQKTELTNAEDEKIKEDGDAIFIKEEPMGGCMIESLTRKTNPHFEANITSNVESIIPGAADITCQQAEPSASQYRNTLNFFCETALIKQQMIDDDMDSRTINNNSDYVLNNSDIFKELDLHHVADITHQDVQINICHEQSLHKMTSELVDTNRLNLIDKETFDNNGFQRYEHIPNNVNSPLKSTTSDLTCDSSNKLAPELKLIHCNNTEKSRVVILKPSDAYINLKRATPFIDEDIVTTRQLLANNDQVTEPKVSLTRTFVSGSKVLAQSGFDNESSKLKSSSVSLEINYRYAKQWKTCSVVSHKRQRK